MTVTHLIETGQVMQNYSGEDRAKMLKVITALGDVDLWKRVIWRWKKADRKVEKERKRIRMMSGFESGFPLPPRSEVLWRIRVQTLWKEIQHVVYTV